MRLLRVLEGIRCRHMRGAHDGIEVLDVAYDSRRATPGCLFVCIPGHAADGHDFAADAVRRGAVALVVTRELDLEVPQVLVEDARDALAVASVALFGDGSRRLDVVGVTGTAGKTTVTHMVEHVVRERGGHAGVIGTVGYRYGSHEMPPTFTTPVSRELQELLGSMADDGCDVCALEVSSHAIATARCAHTHFAATVFTNLSREHLELHGTIEDYFQTKARFLLEADADARVVCAMDDGGRRLSRLLRERGLPMLEVSAERRADVRLVRLEGIGLEGSIVEAEVAGCPVSMRLSVPGDFNARNALTVLGVASALGWDVDACARALEGFGGAPGRMERIAEADEWGVCVLVDYAHTPTELEQAIRAARAGTRGRLAVVFGCGGERDPGNRPLMGRAASAADLVVVTSDNPLSEDPDMIARQTLSGMEEMSSLALVRLDRREAIREALLWAHPGDTVLVAGKGHERTQTVGTHTFAFDDRAVCRELLQGLGA